MDKTRDMVAQVYEGSVGLERFHSSFHNASYLNIVDFFPLLGIFFFLQDFPGRENQTVFLLVHLKNSYI